MPLRFPSSLGGVRLRAFGLRREDHPVPELLFHEFRELLLDLIRRGQWLVRTHVTHSLTHFGPFSTPVASAAMN